MTKIQLLINQLRKTSDLLEDLFISDSSNQSSSTANRILKKKLHWTQTPKGKKILAERSKLISHNKIN